MKIVIDISEDVFVRLFDNGISTSRKDREHIETAIRKGKPLPQHKLTDLEKTTDYSCGWEQGYNTCIDEMLGEQE